MQDIRAGNCPLCDHHEVVEADPPAYYGNDFERDTHVTAEPRRLLPGRNPVKGHGEFRVFFCRSCGFAQWFVLKPESVPIGEDYKTSIIEGKKAQPPFR